MEIGIIGCGSMGAGIAKALSKEHQLFLCDHHPERVAALAKEIGGTAVKTPKEAVLKSELIVLAIKPQDLHTLSAELKGVLNSNKTLVSILAGVSTSKLKEQFKQATTIRMMPNLALIYGKGVIGIVDDSALTKAAKTKLEKVFSSLGLITWLPERLINPLTSLTGSGPAFMMVLIEAMIDAGIAMGFDAETAKSLTLEMISGSLSLLKESKKHPAEIKEQITSPGGTTIAGLKAMEDGAVRSGIMNTFLAAHARSIEMGS